MVSYIGTLGQAHGLCTVLEAAAQLQESLPDAVFLLVGEGAEKEHLVSTASELSLDNVRFLPQQPRESIPALIRASDVCLVTLKKADVFKTVIPSKMLEFMACGRPVVLAVDGQARQLLEDAQGGIYVEPEDAPSLAGAIVRLYHDGPLRQTLGGGGRGYVVQNLSRESTAREYLSVLEQIVHGKGRVAML